MRVSSHLEFRPETYLSPPHGPDVLEDLVEGLQLLGGVGWSRVLRDEHKLLDGCWWLNIHLSHLEVFVEQVDTHLSLGL